MYTLESQIVIFPSISTVGRSNITRITLVDSQAEATNIDVTENMLDNGVLGSGKLWSKPINLRANSVGVIQCGICELYTPTI